MEQSIVSISRKQIDQNRIQGFVLGESSKLILLHYISDFRPDGLMVLRKRDITELLTTDTDRFQTELLINEGIYSEINFDAEYNLDSWPNFLESAIQKHRFFILEQERQKEPEFAIGTITALRNRHVKLKYFTGTARWLEKLEKIMYSNLTACQIGNNYLNIYERYFNGLDDKPR